MIADRAGVSTQTVYNHFPDLGRLVMGCTGHVAGKAPPVGPDQMTEGAPANQRLAELTAALYRRYEFMAPWLRLGLGDAESIPELAEVFAQERAAIAGWIDAALSTEYRSTPDFTDLALVLLDYPAYRQLADRRTTAEATALAVRCLVSLLTTLARPAPAQPPGEENP